MLTKMRLENFKSWRELDLDLSNITILFGTNSSGKSSVLQSLLLLKQTAMGFDRKQPINLGGGAQDYVDFGSYRDLVFEHSEEKHVCTKLEWATDAQIPVSGDRRAIPLNKLAYTVQWEYHLPSGNVVIRRLGYDIISPSDERISLHLGRQPQDNQDKSIVYALEKPSNVEISPLSKDVERFSFGEPFRVESCYAIAPNLSLSGSDFSDLHSNQFSEQFEILVGQMNYLGPLRGYPQRFYAWRGATPKEIGPRGENTIEALLASEHEKRVRFYPTLVSSLLEPVAHWLKEMQLAHEFRIEPADDKLRLYETKVRIKPEKVESSIVDAGFGIAQVLPVITLLFSAPEDSIILLEHPELHLHPCAQSNLADLLLEVAEKRNLQLIVESHSEHLLRRLQRRIAEAENKFATPETIKLYFCELENGESKLRPVGIDKYGQIANWPKDFFGDISGDLDAMTDAALDRRRAELQKQ
jgi:predicted ATPase